MPAKLVHMVERDGKGYIAFCSRQCNARFVARKGKEHQNAKLQQMLKKVEEEFEEENEIEDPE